MLQLNCFWGQLFWFEHVLISIMIFYKAFLIFIVCCHMPSSLLSCFSSFYFLPSSLHSFLLSLLPSFLSSFHLTFLLTFLPSFLPSLSPVFFFPFFLSSFLSSLFPSHLSSFLHSLHLFLFLQVPAMSRKIKKARDFEDGGGI